MGCDLDKAFSYKTSKVVVIQDRWLGILNLAFTVSILCYIIGYEIIWAGGYLEKDSAPNGIVEMSARMPQDNSYYTFSDLPYCKHDYSGPACFEPNYKRNPPRSLFWFVVSCQAPLL